MKIENIILFTGFNLVIILPVFESDSNVGLKQKKASLIKKHLKRLKKQEGAIKLVGGRAEFEGT